MEKAKILDKYILRQLLETFLLGVVIFTSIMFASDTFITLVKQVTNFGISFNDAFLVLILRLPSILVLTIPMGVLLSVVLTYNKLSMNSEITIMRACGIGITRIAKPALVFGITAAITCFILNEAIVPISNVLAKNVTILALSKKNIPDGRTNFSFKDIGADQRLKRLFYISNYKNHRMEGITVLDLSKENAIQVIQSKYGSTNSDFWTFNKGVIYSVSTKGNVLNTTVFDSLDLYNNLGEALSRYQNNKATEMNVISLVGYINHQKAKITKTEVAKLIIELQQKFSIPLMTIAFVLIGIPLSLTPPRVKFNGGFLASILVIFLYYVLRAFSCSLGEAQVISPFLAAWIPLLVIAAIGGFLFYQKAYKI